MMSTPILTTSHYGVVRFGDMAVEAVELEDGTRGYVQRQLATAIGLHESRRGSQLKTLLSDVAPGAAEVLQENACSIRLPSGQTTAFFPAGVISEVASGVIDAALEGRLHRKRQHLVPNCQRILKALAKTGEVALIDEATGYQYHRAPDALQALISRLLRERVASWARRFSPDYYRALFRLFGWHYQGHQQNPPAVIGQITLRWVYDVIMPREIIEEIRNRKRLSDKAHQWLSEGGLALLEKQIHAVTMIARSSMTYRDFDTRCATAFGSQPLQMTLFIGALEGGQ
jgi:hypothetical protein